MEPSLLGLNDKQKEAVTTTKGPVLIIAGAGSGKTKALTHRVAYLITKEVNPASILAVTFTNKAADEMRERVRQLTHNLSFNQLPFEGLINPLRPSNDRSPNEIKGQPTTYNFPFIGTFHAFCAAILRAECSKIGFQKNFTIFDDDDSLSLVKEVMRDLNILVKQYPTAMILRVISGLKNELILPDEYAASQHDDIFPRTVSKIYAEYQKRLKKANGFDFDDLIMCVVRLFKERPDVLEKYQDRFRYIHVDEFQDTNPSQYLLVRLLAQKYGNIFVIGDDAQSIYSWRHADWRNIFNFEKDWPVVKVILLEQNYRSTRTILEAANSLIAQNKYQKKKNLWTENNEGSPLVVTPAEHERHEAKFVTEEIARLLNDERRTPKDIAVLYRTNAQSRSLEEAMLEHSLPYVIIGGIKFFQRKEIKDIVSYIRYLQNRDDLISLKRIINLPPRGIGRTAFLYYLSGEHGRTEGKELANLEKFEKLIINLKKDLTEFTASQFLKTLLKKIRYHEYLDDGSDRAEERWENVKELVSLASRFDKLGPGDGLEKMLEDISLVSYDETAGTKNAEKISLMTVHAAKGLEFPIVFITGLEEGIFPHSKSFSDPAALEEERRLAYVGLTRAKEKLYLSWAFQRLIFGEKQAGIPSRFLKEIPEECIEMRDVSELSGDEEHEDDTFIIR